MPTAIWSGEELNAAVAVITPAGLITEYPLRNYFDKPFAMLAGPDGNVWFTEGSKIGSISRAGAITERSLPTDAVPSDITLGADGNLWLIEANDKIARLTIANALAEFTVPYGSLRSLATGPDGNVWFTDGQKVGRISPEGTIKEFGSTAGGLSDITAGQDGNVWFTTASTIGRVHSDGSIEEFPVPDSAYGIAAGPDGNIWFTEQQANKVARFVPP